METNGNLNANEVVIPAGNRRLHGYLNLPAGANAVVTFAHGSGSGRNSPRNQFVAEQLNKSGLATLLTDLLEDSEAEDRINVFDVELLADRLLAAARWLRQQSGTNNLPLGYFGASTGAAAALSAAAQRTSWVRAIVSRGGRPDLAGDCVPDVQAPTLLIVGELDHVVVDLNRQALDLLTCTKELAIVPGATHLFPEPGSLEEVARLAGAWFLRYLRP